MRSQPQGGVFLCGRTTPKISLHLSIRAHAVGQPLRPFQARCADEAKSLLAATMWRPASDNASIIHFAICLASSGSIRFSWWSLCASQIAVAIIEFTWCRSFKRFSSQSASVRKVSLWAILSRQLKCYHACERDGRASS